MTKTVHSPDSVSMSNGIELDSSSMQKAIDITDSRMDTSDNKDSQNFTISIHKKCIFSLYKPLIPLKLALFILYGAGSLFATFLVVIFKQKGMTLTEVSIIYIITPVVQFFGPAICGIIADKIGRSKPVLVANLVLTILFIACTLALPKINKENCDQQFVNLTCHSQDFGHLIAKKKCAMNTNVIQLASCNVTCPENVTQYCHEQNLICNILENNETFENLSLEVHVNYAYKLKNDCNFNVTSVSHKNTTYSWCNVQHKIYCRIYCLMNSEDDCSEINENRTKYLIMYMVVLILLFTVFSTSFRIMDVTAMCLVKDHNSDFGRERFFAITGIVVFTPLGGYIVDASTSEGDEKNYNTVFYVLIGLTCLLICILYKLEVKIRPPGKHMWKKSLQLLKNPDYVAFLLVLIVLGMSWGFTKYFRSLYLEGMNSPGILLGLINSISALYGLPFLITSKWWGKKIGATKIFALGLLAHTTSGFSYSLLYNPWLALLIEATSIFSYHLLWVSVIVHSHSIAPEGLTSTVIACGGGVHFGIGRGIGGSMGGFIMEAYGGRMAFTVIASICLVSAVLYAVYLYVRRTCFVGSQKSHVQEQPMNATYEEGETFLKK